MNYRELVSLETRAGLGWRGTWGAAGSVSALVTRHGMSAVGFCGRPFRGEQIGFLAFSVSSLVQQMCKNSASQSVGFRAWESCAMYVICTALENTSGGKPRKAKLKIMSVQNALTAIDV